VEALSEQPGDPEKLLIGYNRGLIVLWNRADEGKIEKVFIVIVYLFAVILIFFLTNL